MSVVGDRYAESLFDLAKEENKVTQYLDDIKLVGEVLDSDPQIVQFFNHVLIENDKKIQLLDQSFKGNVDQYVLNFLKLLVQSRRIRYIDDIVKSYIKLSNQYLGIEEGMIYTPYELTDQQIQDIEKAISQKENKKVTLKVSIDPSLLGGIKVQIANRIYDGTIKNNPYCSNSLNSSSPLAFIPSLNLVGILFPTRSNQSLNVFFHS